MRLKFGNTERNALVDLLDADTEVTAMAQAYLDIISQAGVSTPLLTRDLIDGWITRGIPREVWHGYARFDRYSKAAGKDYYVGQHAQVIRVGANALRGIITNYIQSWKMLLDLENVRTAGTGNPGGVALGPTHAPPAP
jgi:hypothetical protein